MSRTREGADEAQDPSQVVQNHAATVQHANETPVLYEEGSSAVAPIFTSRDLAEIISGSNNRGTIFTGRDLADIIGGNSSTRESSSAVFKSVDSFVSKFNSTDSYGKMTPHFNSNDENKPKPRRRLDSIDTLASTEYDDLCKQSPLRQNSSGFPCTSSGDTITVPPYAASAVGRECTSPTTMELTMDALDVLSGKMKRPGNGGFNAMFASSDWQGNFRTEHIDVEYQGMFSSADRQQAGQLKMRSDEMPHFREVASDTQGIPRTDWMKEFNTIFSQPAPSQTQTAVSVVEPTPPSFAPPITDQGLSLDAQVIPRTDWMKEFHTIFNQQQALPVESLPIPLPLATLQSEDNEAANNSASVVPPVGNMEGVPAPAPEQKKKKVKKRRSQEPEVKEYVDNPTNDDVLLGRGGRSNHHSGNKRYRDEIVALQTLYRDASKDGKTEISQLLVDRVRSYGGRFLKLDESVHRWYLVKNIVARRKASQALRETNTPEVRQAKRERLAKKKPGTDNESMESV